MNKYRIVFGLAMGFVAVGGVGCGVSEVLVEVNSHPEGATVWLDGVEKGLTPIEKLLVSFVDKPHVELTVTLEGYQLEEALLFPADTAERPVHNFALKEAPQLDEVFKRLDNLQEEQEKANQRLTEIQRELANLKPENDTGS